MQASFLTQVAKITDNLYLSSFVGTSEYNIQKYNINCVITVCNEVPKVTLKHVESFKFDVADKPTESLSKYFDFIADKIHEISRKKGVCLVHCVAGISRSATIVIAYLMKHLKMNLRDAHSFVKSKRPFIRPNLGFWRQLFDYEHKLFGKNSVKIIPSPVGFIPDVYENEVKNLQWSAQTQPSELNVRSLTGQPANNLAKFQDKQTIQINANSNSNSKEQMNSLKILPPIIGNSIAKLNQSQNSSNQQQLINVNNDKLNNKNDQATYTTTYRSSYQRP